MSNFPKIKEISPIPGWRPIEASISITGDCTFRCVTCPLELSRGALDPGGFRKSSEPSKPKKVPPSEAARIESEVAAHLANGVKVFVIEGGEPFLYPDFVLMLIRKIKAAGCYVEIRTNGALIDHGLARSLSYAEPDFVKVSIFGPNDEIQSQTVGVPDTFLSAIYAIRYIAEQKISVVPDFVASHFNVKYMYDTGVALYECVQLKNQSFSVFIPNPSAPHHARYAMTDDDYKIYFKALKSLRFARDDLQITSAVPAPSRAARGFAKTRQKCRPGDFKHAYKLCGHIIRRPEPDGCTTIINPKTRGYCVLKNMPDAAGGLRFSRRGAGGVFAMLSAMNALEKTDAWEHEVGAGTESAEKYKILSGSLGRGFNSKKAVYEVSTDTAWNFYCLANSAKEKSIYAAYENSL